MPVERVAELAAVERESVPALALVLVLVLVLVLIL
jgi:hypothetical protein